MHGGGDGVLHPFVQAGAGEDLIEQEAAQQAGDPEAQIEGQAGGGQVQGGQLHRPQGGPPVEPAEGPGHPARGDAPEIQGPEDHCGPQEDGEQQGAEVMQPLQQLLLGRVTLPGPAQVRVQQVVNDGVPGQPQEPEYQAGQAGPHRGPGHVNRQVGQGQEVRQDDDRQQEEDHALEEVGHCRAAYPGGIRQRRLQPQAMLPAQQPEHPAQDAHQEEVLRKETGGFGEMKQGGALQGKEPQGQISGEDLQRAAIEAGRGGIQAEQATGVLAGKKGLHQGQGQAPGPGAPRK